MNIISEKTPARDASGVPLPLREMLGLLAELAESLPIPAGGNWDAWRNAQNRRQSLVSSRLILLTGALKIHDKYPGSPEINEKMLADFCERSIAAARQMLAEPLGYEPRPAEDGAK
jgi:hypothetical protein